LVSDADCVSVSDKKREKGNGKRRREDVLRRTHKPSASDRTDMPTDHKMNSTSSFFLFCSIFFVVAVIGSYFSSGIDKERTKTEERDQRQKRISRGEGSKTEEDIKRRRDQRQKRRSSRSTWLELEGCKLRDSAA
jgi:hypothetical protein